MRRHTSFISQAKPIFRYLSKSGGISDGSLQARNWRDAIKAFGQFEEPYGNGLVQFTLSLPPEVELSPAGWHAVSCHVLTASGLPPTQTPWLAWGGEATHCDHIHIIAARQTFLGRTLDISTSIRATDRLERDLRERLGLEEGLWREDPALSLSPTIPLRRTRTNAEAARLGSDLNAAFKLTRPTNTNELNVALTASKSPWRVEQVEGPSGYLMATNLLISKSINPRRAGPAFGSAAIIQRLALAARLRAIAAAILIRRAAALIHDWFPDWTLKTGDTHDQIFNRARSNADQTR